MSIQGKRANGDLGEPDDSSQNANCHIVPFQQVHAKSATSLFVKINHELTPGGMEEEFAAYIRHALDKEVDRIGEYFDPSIGNSFWVMLDGDTVIGMFGLERRSTFSAELRRMYLEKSYRGRGLADRMLAKAETEALRQGYRRIVLWTAEIQAAAVAFYRRKGFCEIGVALTEIGDHKSVGGGLTRMLFEKELDAALTERERLIRWDDPIVLASAARNMSGRDFLEKVLHGNLPLPPICNLVDFTFEEFGEGRAVMILRPHEAQYNPIGSVHGGIIATVLDSVMGCAVHTKLPKGQGYTTLEIKVNYLKPVGMKSGPMRAIGTAIHSGRLTATAEGALMDASGKVYATASTTCLLLPL